MISLKQNQDNSPNYNESECLYAPDGIEVDTKFLSIKTGMHIRQVQRLAKKGLIPKTKKEGKTYSWLYSDIQSYISEFKKKQKSASNDPAY